MSNPYSVFQTESDPTPTAGTTCKGLRALGFFGRVLEGTGIIAVTLTLAALTLTSAARANALLADAASSTTPLIGIALLVVFAVMLAMVRQTWRQTAKGINSAPRRSHRIR